MVPVNRLGVDLDDPDKRLGRHPRTNVSLRLDRLTLRIRGQNKVDLLKTGKESRPCSPDDQPACLCCRHDAARRRTATRGGQTLAAGDVNKNDPNDARSVAVAALRPAACLPVRADDHAAVLKVWAKRYRDLSRARNQVVCRMHAVLCQLIPGGVSTRITAGQAARILDQAEPRGAAGMARWVLAAQLLTGLRRIDVQRRDVQRKLAVAVRASGTTVTGIFGVGPAVAAAVIGDAGDISRFASRDHFAAYNGTAPVEVSSGGRVIYRLSLRGNRRMNHAIHMAAVTQIRYRHSKGRAYYDKKIAEGKTSKEALRALKRQVSDAVYQRMKADGRRAAAGPGGHPGNGSEASVAGLHPADRLFGQATPGPTPTLRPRPGRSKAAPAGRSRRTRPAVPAHTSA